MKNEKKEKAQLETQIKNILYFVEDNSEQQKMIGILTKTCDQLPDGKLKDGFQKFIYSTKTTYYEKVDYLVRDILNSIWDDNTKAIISRMIDEIQPVAEKAERTIWDKLRDYFKWS